MRDRMKDIEEVIDALLARRPDGFRNKHFAAALGVSRSRASRVLARLCISGELRINGDGRGPYIRGRDDREHLAGVARGAPKRCFWRDLLEELPTAAYLGLRLLGLTEIRKRQQIRLALQGLTDSYYLIVDFEGVRFISKAAAHELCVVLQHFWGTFVQPINMEADVGRTIRDVLALNNHREEQRAP